MQVGELFVNLGIKGTDSAVSALSGVRKKLNDVTSTSWQAKAGILGVMYGFAHLASGAAEVGASLTQFNNETDASIDKLQRWQNVLRQSGVTSEETESAIREVQKRMAGMVLRGDAPEALTAFTRVVGGIPQDKINDPYYLFEKAREYAQRTKAGGVDAGISNEILSSLIGNQRVIGALRTNHGDINKVDTRDIYTGKQVAAQNKVSVGMSNIENRFEHGMGRIVAKFGPKMIGDISHLADQIVKMSDAFASFAENVHLLEGFSYVLKGWTEIFATVADVMKELSGKTTKNSKNGIVPNKTQLDYMLGIYNTKDYARDFKLHKPPAVPQTINNSPSLTFNIDGGDFDEKELAKYVNQEISKTFADSYNKAFRPIDQVHK